MTSAHPDEFEIYPMIAGAVVKAIPADWKQATLILRPTTENGVSVLEHTLLGPTKDTSIEPTPEVYEATRLLHIYFLEDPPIFEEASVVVEQAPNGNWRHRSSLRYAKEA